MRWALLEIILILIVLAVLLALPIGIGLIFYYGHKRNRKSRAAWAKAAEELGLNQSPGALALDGVVNGKLMTIVVEVEGSGDSRHYKTAFTATFDRPLFFLLAVRDVSFFNKSGAVALGHPAFDGTFRADAADHDLLRRLLSSPAKDGRTIADDLVMLRRSVSSLAVTDHALKVTHPGIVCDTYDLVSCAQNVAVIAEIIERNRHALAAGNWERGLHQNWSRTAQKTGMSFDADQLSMTGTAFGVPLEAEIDTQSQNWETRFAVNFPQSLNLGLRISKTSGLHKLTTFLGAQDIEMGEPLFDESFIVKATDENRVRAILDPDLRQLLVSMHNVGANIVVDDICLEFTFSELIGDPAILYARIQAVTEIAKKFVRNRQTTP